MTHAQRWFGPWLVVLSGHACTAEDGAARSDRVARGDADAGSQADVVEDQDGAEGGQTDEAPTADDTAADDTAAPSEGPADMVADPPPSPPPTDSAEPEPAPTVKPGAELEPEAQMVEPEPVVDPPAPEPDPSTPGSVVDPGPLAGNGNGGCAIPSDAQPEDTSNPDRVIGDGSPESCTSEAVVSAVALGGIITFDCGPDPITITLTEPAKIVNATGPNIVIDGGGLVTLSGGGTSRILYMNTCDEDQGWTTSECQNQDHPRLTVQNLTFVDANSKGETEYDGGGAIWVRGGRFKVLNSRFFGNVCADEGPDVGGGAIRVFSQFDGLPVYVVNSTFGGEGLGNVCSNGGALSSIGVSWTIIDSVFTHNRAIGNGGNPAEAGSPGGGSGGAIYNDGNTMTLSLCASRIEHNEVNAYGSAIFFVSNDHSGNIEIANSVISNNVGGSWYPTYPQISNHDDTPIAVTNSTIE